MSRLWFLSRFWVKAEEGRKFQSLKVQEASSSHLKTAKNEQQKTDRGSQPFTKTQVGKGDFFQKVRFVFQISKSQKKYYKSLS